MYLCVCWGPGGGWGPSPFDLPAWLGAGNSSSLTIAGALPTFCSWRWGWGGVGRRLFALAPWLAVPQLPSCHALTLPGTPGLRYGAASSGCPASFPRSEGSCPPKEASRTCAQENPYPVLTFPHQEEPLAPSRCPGKSAPRALRPGADHRLNSITLHLLPAHTARALPLWDWGVISCGPAQGIVQSHTLSYGQAALHPPIVILKNVLCCWPRACCPQRSCAEGPTTVTAH